MSKVQEWAEEAGLDIHVRLWAFSEGEDKCHCAECEQARELYEAWLREQMSDPKQFAVTPEGQPESRLSVAQIERYQNQIQELESALLAANAKTETERVEESERKFKLSDIARREAEAQLVEAKEALQLATALRAKARNAQSGLQAQLREANARNQRLEILGAQFAGRLAGESMDELAAAAGRAVDVQGRIEELEAQLVAANKRYESAVNGRRSFRQMYREGRARITELQAQLAEANARADIWERNYKASEFTTTKALRLRAEKAETELTDAIKAIEVQAALYGDANTRAERQTRRADSYARTAEACLRDAGPALVEARERAERLRAALEKVEWDGYNEVYGLSECLWCGGFETKGHKEDCARQLALAGKSKPAPAIKKTLTNQHGQPFCVYLSDGQKIGIQRDGGAAWLRIEDTPVVQAALTPEKESPTQ